MKFVTISPETSYYVLDRVFECKKKVYVLLEGALSSSKGS